MSPFLFRKVYMFRALLLIFVGIAIGTWGFFGAMHRTSSFACKVLTKMDTVFDRTEKINHQIKKVSEQ